MRRTPGEDNPVRSLAIAFEMDSFLDKYSKIFIVFGEHRSFISVHLIVTLSLLIAIDFFCILAPGYCAEYKIVHEILMACQDICVKHIDKVGEINGEIKSLGSARSSLRCELPRPHTKFRVSALRDEFRRRDDATAFSVTH